MRLSAYVCVIVAAVFVITAGITAWVDSGSEHGDVASSSTAQGVDLETQIGVEAARDDPRIGKPRSLHSSKPPSQGSVPERFAANEPVLKVPAGTHPVVGVREGAKVAVRTEPGGDLVEVIGDRTEFGSPTVFGVARIEGRWLGISTPSLPNRLGWIRHDLGRLRVGWTDNSIHVKLSKRRATLRAGGRNLLTFTVTVGAPGTRTPTGRFAVTDTFRGDLNPVYGCCAVALSAVQPDLPPGWPGGNRIAFHGNGTGQALGLAASNGCLRAHDEAVSTLVDEIDLGAPVFIRS